MVGGGITGLVTAYRLARLGRDVTVFEADDRAGGKILTTPFAGLPAVDCGADAFLARVPAGVGLCSELGFGDELISPANGSAYIWSRGALRRIPVPNFLGVPLDLDSLRASGIVSDEAVDLAAADLTRARDLAMPDGDESVGSLVRRRLGDEVLERLVDPLLGGIYAGDADRLSLEAGAPQIAAAARADASLIRGLTALRSETAADPDAPIFFAPPDGMSRLVRELAATLGDRLRLGRPVHRIERSGAQWSVDGERFDQVVLATPAHVTASLVRDTAPDSADALARIDYAGVALVTMAIPRDAAGRPLDASGFLVPKAEQALVTACSWTSTKWAHLDHGSHAILRASAGSYGDERAFGLDDDALIDAMLAELTEMMDLRGEPVEVRVTRWPRSFPQYQPGHVALVESIEAALAREAPGVTVAGAAYRGIGIPACVTQAERAASHAASLDAHG